MTKYTDIINYFKAFAEKYVLHTDTEKHFYRKGWDEFFNGLTIAANYPAMLFHKYELTFDDNSYDNVTKDRTVAFSIISHISDIDDYEAQDLAMDECEGIVGKIFNDMRADSKDARNSTVQFTKITSFSATPLENYADGNYGYYCTVDISSIHKTVNS